MSRKDEIKKLIGKHHRHLQKLKEQRASFGTLHTPAHILTEIEDTEAAIEELETNLKTLEDSGGKSQGANIISDAKKDAPKYYVAHAEQSAIGDFARVNNYISPQEAATDSGLAALKTMFETVNRRLAALEEADRALVTPAVEQAVAAATAIQQGDESEEKQSFLEARLKALYLMRQDIGEVIVAALVSPPAGIALTLQKIGRKVKETVD